MEGMSKEVLGSLRLVTVRNFNTLQLPGEDMGAPSQSFFGPHRILPRWYVTGGFSLSRPPQRRQHAPEAR